MVPLFGQRLRRGHSPVEHRGTFVCHSVCPFVPPQALSDLKSALSGQKSALSGFESALSGLKYALSGLKSVLSGLKSVLLSLKSVLSGLKPALADSKPERADFRPERVNFRPERTDFRPEMAWGEWTDGRIDERKSPCVLQDLVPFGAAVLLPPFPFHNHAKQGNGYR